MLRQARGLLRSLTLAVPRRHVTKDLGHAKKPYEPVHHDTYPAGPPRMFGRKPGEPLESYEIMTISTFLLCIGIVIYGNSTKESDDFLVWARREALAREAVIANGGTVEFGKYYQKKLYVEDESDNTPKIEE